ncbi:hypothetical protein LSUB1_G001948 [Lachnellula subtilissima]|uniref:Uncharacterized protein n=1 Tax=Lachnellula subtilissima TaxID=602034 RepID=A0A8H8RUM0_9HELO|nr:hypothetical protein LSUB1_G001948 [Lachnellula subtilissima]
MDFAPYQDQSPETNRALSPPPSETRRSFSPNVRPAPALSPTSTPPAHPTSNPWIPSSAQGQGFSSGDVEEGGGGDFGGREERLNEFETSLPIRLDYEACLAYLLLPPAGGVLLLLLEQKSDYVRFHAWQSALLFTAVFVLHLIFSWSTFLSWTMFVCDVAGIGYLSFRAYGDAETLDRCEVPFFGRLASSILDDE